MPEGQRSSPEDKGVSPGIPAQRTLALVNTYIVHTTRLLNDFAIAAEDRLQLIKSRCSLRYSLQILDAHLRH